jgi:hypothetical protein
MERNGRDPQRRTHGAEAGRQTTLQQSGAKLDAVGAALLGRDEPVDAFDANLDQGI